MRYAAVVLLACLLAAGCGPRGAPQPWHRGSAPASALEQIQQGMGYGQVTALLGPPTDKSSVHITGKIWIPFYFGDDAYEENWHYKDQGRVIFSGGVFFPMAVYKVQVDPGESGYYRR